MQASRRQFLSQLGQFFGAVATVALLPVAAFAARNEAAFKAKTLDDLVKAYGKSGAKQSDDIKLTTPEIAENGAVVPVTVDSSIAGSKSVSILVEKNPDILAARFEIPEGTDPFVTTRVKVAESCNIYAVVETADGAFYTQKPIKVTLGGCGG